MLQIPGGRGPNRALVAALACFALPLLLVGCLEQVQSPHIPSGSLNNFLLHLEAGELDDARSYFAPGLVTPSPQLDSRLQDDSARLRRYQITGRKSRDDDLGNGAIKETVSARVRPVPPAGAPTPTANEGWVQTDVITARMVVRGPGWRILDYSLLCCP